MDEFVAKIWPFLLTAALSGLVATLLSRRNRVVIKEDAQESVTRQETKDLADNLAEQRRLLALSVEQSREDRARLLADTQVLFGRRFDDFERIVLDRLAVQDQQLNTIEVHLKPLIQGMDRLIVKGIFPEEEIKKR